MTDPVALVRTRLLAIAAVTALAGTRVYAGAWPQAPSASSVLLRMIGRVEQSHLRGGVDLMQARVQAHYMATNRSGAVALANAAEGDGLGSGLVRFTGSVGGVRVAAIFHGGTDREEFHGDEILKFEVLRDYLIHYAR